MKNKDIRDAKGLNEEEFLAQYNADKYPKPSLTADIVIFRLHDDDRLPDALFIRRKGHPYIGCLALPGGFAEKGETIETTAARELEEETGVELESENSETIGGFIIDLMGEIPKARVKYDPIRYEEYEFTILKVKDRRIEKVRISVTGEAEDRDE